MGNTSNNPFHQSTGGWFVQWSKTQGIQQRNRPSAHRENVTQDATNPRGSSLKRLNSRGVVMAFNFERQTVTFTQIHHASVLSRAHKDAWAFCWETTQQGSGIAVTAMLRPHHTKHAQLSTIGIPSKPTLNFAVIRFGEPFLAQSCPKIKCRNRMRGLGHNR